ncbi:MAG: hypothetical protein COT85_04675 [Chlamydiae bacterium CG10_big_fil_rev_8_21_14_0_10_42_34]|nr:MAG: hypothetical protein COT85_04675 [Chlamydiae bacterium CG10_big_fil_rev_8_21_14_0_10_42_34]
MNFTREPIIETVITPREGCKLVIRSSKGNGQEDYFVDAVEVVSFGHSFFFRSQERPKSFLVPVSDYEILELKETRMVLKNVSSDRSIKIGGGREAPPRPREEVVQDPTLAESRPAPAQEPRTAGKRDKRRRGRRGRDRNDQPPETREPQNTEQNHEGRDSAEENQKTSEGHQPEQGQSPQAEAVEKAPSFISKLFPPPTTLIRESLSRYKPTEVEGESLPDTEKQIIEEIISEQPIPIDKELENESEE